MYANSGKVQVNSVAVRDYIQTQLAALQTLSAGILGNAETNKLFGKNGKKNNAPVAALPNMSAAAKGLGNMNMSAAAKGLGNMSALSSLPSSNGRRNNAPNVGSDNTGAAGNGAAPFEGNAGAGEPPVEGASGEPPVAGGARRRRKKSVKGKKRRTGRKH